MRDGKYSDSLRVLVISSSISVMAAGIAQKLQKNEADPDSVQLAKSAINYALRRVRIFQ